MPAKTKRPLFRFRRFRNRPLPCSRLRRAGTTLTEALISMGVASVGMFGVFVLIPFCGRQAELGLDYDLSAAAAKEAVERFEVMQMNNPDAWAFANGAPVNAANYNPPYVPIPYLTQWRGGSICIDPRMITRNGNTRFTFPTTAFETDTSTSPNRNAPPVMNRVTLFNRGGTVMVQGTKEMRALSDHIFQSSNDLIFIEPVDKQALPAQQYEDNAARLPVRASKGKMSWMAMISPQPISPSSDLYRLYIIVFKNRDLSISGEAVLNISFTGTGSGGGDAQLSPGTTPSGTVLTPPAGEEFRIHRGSWLMVCRNIEGGPQVNTPVFGWYRVSKFDKISGFVTLEGSDWTPTTQPAAASYCRDYAVFLPHVQMVYEKTIRLESPSLWSPQ